MTFADKSSLEDEQKKNTDLWHLTCRYGKSSEPRRMWWQERWESLGRERKRKNSKGNTRDNLVRDTSSSTSRVRQHLIIRMRFIITGCVSVTLHLLPSNLFWVICLILAITMIKSLIYPLSVCLAQQLGLVGLQLKHPSSCWSNPIKPFV